MFGRGYWQLPQSRLKLFVPDHVSYRRDGSMYQAGVEPDVYAPFEQRDAERAKAHALVEGLRVALERVGESPGNMTAAGETHVHRSDNHE